MSMYGPGLGADKVRLVVEFRVFWCGCIAGSAWLKSPTLFLVHS